MTTLDSGFEDALAESLLDDAEAKMVDEAGNIVFEFVERVHERLRAFGNRLDYHVEPIIDSFELIGVQRDDRGITVRLGWTHEAAVYMEFGTSPHTIEGNPILSFIWEERHDPPEWVQNEYNEEGDGWRVFLPEVEVAGVEKIRQIRNALMWFRRRLS